MQPDGGPALVVGQARAALRVEVVRLPGSEPPRPWTKPKNALLPPLPARCRCGCTARR